MDHLVSTQALSGDEGGRLAGGGHRVCIQRWPEVGEAFPEEGRVEWSFEEQVRIRSGEKGFWSVCQIH